MKHSFLSEKGTEACALPWGGCTGAGSQAPPKFGTRVNIRRVLGWWPADVSQVQGRELALLRPFKIDPGDTYPQQPL